MMMDVDAVDSEFDEPEPPPKKKPAPRSAAKPVPAKKAAPKGRGKKTVVVCFFMLRFLLVSHWCGRANRRMRISMMNWMKSPKRR